MKLGEVLSTSSNRKKYVKEVLSTSEMSPFQIRSRALSIADGLTSTEKPHDFTSWYCKAYKTLGEGKYAAIASMARKPDVDNPKTLFGHLLKQEMRSVAR